MNEGGCFMQPFLGIQEDQAPSAHRHQIPRHSGLVTKLCDYLQDKHMFPFTIKRLEMSYTHLKYSQYPMQYKCCKLYIMLCIIMIL